MIRRLLLIPTSLACLAAAEGETPSAITYGFEADAEGWSFSNGKEFPGATGDATMDANVARSGKSSLKLAADFSAGGRYVACGKTINPTKAAEFRCWVKAENVKAVTGRFTDGTGAAFQKSIEISGDGSTWQEVVFTDFGEPVKGEGKWKGALNRFLLVINQRGMADPAQKKATLWLDDVRIVTASP